MSEHAHSPGGTHGKPYETTDASVHAVSVTGVWIFITVAIAMILMAGTMWVFLRMPPPMDRKPTAKEMERAVPQAPLLQVDEPGDLAKFKAHEEQLIHSYGRQPNSGAIRIPVGRAIEIIAERGIGAKPAEAAKPPAEAAPVAAPAKPVAPAKPAGAAKH